MHPGRSRPPIRFPLKMVVIILLLGLCSAALVRPAHAAPPVHQAAVETFARDVYFIEGATLRTPNDTTSLSANLFNVAGVSLGITWGDWARATGGATVHSIGNGATARTDVELQLT